MYSDSGMQVMPSILIFQHWEDQPVADSPVGMEHRQGKVKGHTFKQSRNTANIVGLIFHSTLLEHQLLGRDVLLQGKKCGVKIVFP